MAKQFEVELEKLHQHLMDMGINVSEQLYQATKSFIEHDKALAETVIKQDDGINQSEIDLEKQALYMMALEQPVASSFREIISILKASYDLERIGDQDVGIARETIQIKGNQRVPEIEAMIAKMTGDVSKMLEEALDAYFKADAAAARKIATFDDTIDQDYHQIRQAISGLTDETVIPASTSYLLVTRFLERSGDNVVSITEWGIYSQTGHIVELNGDYNKRH
ncbi:MAG: phosphate signaling complex protein PhoU [Lactobacillus sp.]|nr:phosphate signaling complex protein PhoU [Lactobacillus sp.]